jgi:hypothetical protein
MPLLFQYGSNTDAARLNDKTRLAGAAEDVGRAETVDEYDLAFDVWSGGNGCAASDLVLVPGTGRHLAQRRFRGPVTRRATGIERNDDRSKIIAMASLCGGRTKENARPLRYVYNSHAGLVNEMRVPR